MVYLDETWFDTHEIVSKGGDDSVETTIRKQLQIKEKAYQ